MRIKYSRVIKNPKYKKLAAAFFLHMAMSLMLWRPERTFFPRQKNHVAGSKGKVTNSYLNKQSRSLATESTQNQSYGQGKCLLYKINPV